jgi:putative membrane protein
MTGGKWDEAAEAGDGGRHLGNRTDWKRTGLRSFFLIVGALASVSARASEAAAEPYNLGPQMMWGWGWYGMIFGTLLMILVLAVVIAVAVLLVRWIGGPWQPPASPHHQPPGRTPLDILKERFAPGEIGKDEFEERRRVLGE